jgi:uncharacterized integral membrane protein
MPWKLIFAIFFILIIIALIGFNWSFTSNVSVGFHEFENVPVLLTIGISFVAGALFAIPYSVQTTLRIKKKQAKKLSASADGKEKELVKKIEKSKKTPRRKKRNKEAQPLPDVPAEPEDS